MFTALVFGLCAFVVESDGMIKNMEVARYPAVAIGVVAKARCRVNMVLAEGFSTPLLPMNGIPHSFRVEKITQSTAVISMDEIRSFSIPRPHSF
jgi:hypothetical protein